MYVSSSQEFDWKQTEYIIGLKEHVGTLTGDETSDMTLVWSLCSNQDHN